MSSAPVDLNAAKSLAFLTAVLANACVDEVGRLRKRPETQSIKRNRKQRKLDYEYDRRNPHDSTCEGALHRKNAYDRRPRRRHVPHLRWPAGRKAFHAWRTWQRHQSGATARRGLVELFSERNKDHCLPEESETPDRSRHRRRNRSLHGRRRLLSPCPLERQPAGFGPQSGAVAFGRRGTNMP